MTKKGWKRLLAGLCSACIMCSSAGSGAVWTGQISAAAESVTEGYEEAGTDTPAGSEDAYRQDESQKIPDVQDLSSTDQGQNLPGDKIYSDEQNQPGGGMASNGQESNPAGGETSLDSQGQNLSGVESSGSEEQTAAGLNGTDPENMTNTSSESQPAESQSAASQVLVGITGSGTDTLTDNKTKLDDGIQETEEETSKDQEEASQTEPKLYTVDGQNCRIRLVSNRYAVGSAVTVQLIPETGYQVSRCSIEMIGPVEDETDPMVVLPGSPDLVYKGMVAPDQAQELEDGIIEVVFTMPQRDVCILAEADLKESGKEETGDPGDTTTEKGDANDPAVENDGDDRLESVTEGQENDAPDKAENGEPGSADESMSEGLDELDATQTISGGVTRVDFTTPYGQGSIYKFPTELVQSPSGGQLGTAIKELTVYGSDGKKVDKTVLGFCLQSSKDAPVPSNKTKYDELSSSKEMDVAKAIFYLYLGPGFSYNITGKDGKTYNIKELYEKYGIDTKEERYAMTHLTLSKLYYEMKGSPSDWTWNAAMDGSRNTYKNVTTDKGKKFLKELTAALDQLAMPECMLSHDVISKGMMIRDPGTGRYRTPDITYSSMKDNKLSLTVPSGLTMYNRTAGTSSSAGATATINGGSVFYFMAADNVSGSRSVSLTPSLFGSTQQYRVIFGDGYQDIGFGYSEVGGSFTLSMDFPEQTAPVRLQKLDSQSADGTPLYGYVSLQGAEYGIYSNPECQDSSLVARLSTDENGNSGASKQLTPADYYVKETKAPDGYALDSTVYSIPKADLMASALRGETYTITVKDRMIRGNIGIEKILSFGSNQDPVPAKGISFKLTNVEDPDITFEVEEGKPNIITTNEEGYASTVSDSYPYGTLVYGHWTVEEVAAPEGFTAIEPFTVEISADGQLLRYTADNREIQSGLLIRKVDQLTGNAIPLSGVGFSLYMDDQKVSIYDPALQEKVDYWVTGEDGTVQLPARLKNGTYIVKENPDTVPAGYLCMEDQQIVISQKASDPENPITFTAEEPVKRGEICIMKKDAEQKIPVAGAVFEISAAQDIVDASGQVRTWNGADGQAVILNAGQAIAQIETGEDGTAVLGGLFQGAYRITEVKVPAGYVGSGQSVNVDLTDTDQSSASMSVQTEVINSPITVQISKQDITNSQELEGASLTIRDQEGNVVESWISGKEPHLIYALPAGTYTLTEVTAPKGYEVAESITFEVKETLEIQTVVMKDQPVEEPTEKTTEKKAGGVKTGDETDLLTWFMLMGLSMLAVMAMVAAKRRKADR